MAQRSLAGIPGLLGGLLWLVATSAPALAAKSAVDSPLSDVSSFIEERVLGLEERVLRFERRLAARIDGVPVDSTAFSKQARRLLEEAKWLRRLAYRELGGGGSHWAERAEGVSARLRSLGEFDRRGRLAPGARLGLGNWRRGGDSANLGEGAISGLVTAVADGLPVTSGGVWVYNAHGQYEDSVSLDEEGRFNFFDLAPGSYFVRTSTAYIDELWDDLPCESSCQETDGDPIVVLATGTIEGVDFALDRGGIIAGRVLDSSTGQPLADVWIEAHDESGQDWEFGYTDIAGRYELTGLQEGVYFVNTDGTSEHRDEIFDDIPCTGTCGDGAGTPINVVLNGLVDDIDFDLDRLGSISGSVTEVVGGAPISSPRIRVFDFDGNYVAEATGGASGEYRVGGLETGSYRVATRFFGDYRDEVYDDVPCEPDCVVGLGLPIDVVEGVDTPGIDFALNRFGAIAGSVSEEGTGLPVEVEVWLWNDEGQAVDIDFQNAGLFVFGGLEPGEYRLSTARSGFLVSELFDDVPCPGQVQPACDLAAGAEVPVVLDMTAGGIDIALSRGGWVSGSLEDLLTSSVIRYENVRIYDSAGHFVFEAESDELGAYLIAGLSGGDYFVATDTYRFVDEVWDDMVCEGCNPTTGTSVAVVIGAATTGIDFELLRREAIAGRVTDIAGNPLPGVALDAWEFDGSYRTSGVSGPDGRYQIEFNSSGNYYVSTDAAGEALDEVYDDIVCPDGPASTGDCDPTQGVQIIVTAQAPAVLDIDFALAGALLFADGFEGGDTSAWSATVP